jgi:hypothetical protein
MKSSQRRVKDIQASFWSSVALGDLAGVEHALNEGAALQEPLASYDLSWAFATLGPRFPREELEGISPLGLSALMGRHKVFEKLWEAGADPLAKNARGFGAMGAAMKSQKIRMAMKAMDLFEARGLVPDAGALGLAVMWARPGLITRLLGLGADPNEFFDGETPMTLAARRGVPALARLLAKGGGSIESRRADGAAALSIAAARSHMGCMRAALELGADLEGVNHEGQSALHCCILNSWPHAARLLASQGARLEEPWPAGGLTPLGRAARAGRYQTMEALLEHGANPHRVGSNGPREGGLNALLATFLSTSPRDRRYCDQTRCARLAIGAGVDLEAENSAGHWPLLLALGDYRHQWRRRDLLDLLCGARTDLEHRCPEGVTLLEREVLRCLTPGYGVEGSRVLPLLERGALVTGAIKDALDRQAQWQPTYQKGWSLEWVDWVKAAALRQDEARELNLSAKSAPRSPTRRM